MSITVKYAAGCGLMAPMWAYWKKSGQTGSVVRAAFSLWHGLQPGPAPSDDLSPHGLDLRPGIQATLLASGPVELRAHDEHTPAGMTTGAALRAVLPLAGGNLQNA